MALPGSSRLERANQLDQEGSQLRQKLGLGLYVPQTGPDGNETAGLRDAFGRLQVSGPTNVFSWSAGNQSTAAAALTVVPELTGTGTATPSNGWIRLGASEDATSTAWLRSAAPVIYQPGKSHTVKVTATIYDYSDDEVQKQVGYFSDEDGIFFEFTNSIVYAVRRTSTSGSAVDNKTDVTSKVGDLDFTKSQMFWFDMESVGRARWGVVDPVTNERLVIHEEVGANTLAAPYMQTFNLYPGARWRVEGTGAVASYMDIICMSVESEGGLEDVGQIQSYARTAGFTSTAGIDPLISFRLTDAGSRKGTVVPMAVEIFTNATSKNWRWALFADTTVTGGSWSSTNSLIETNISGTSISGGYELMSGYGATANPVKVKLCGRATDMYRLGVKVREAGQTFDPQEWALVMDDFGSGGAFYARLTWKELS